MGLRSINPGETAPSMRLMAYVSGLGFGIMSGVFSFVNTLSDSLGPGMVGIHGDPPQCFLNAAFMTLGSYCCTCSGALCVWMPVRRKKWYALLVVLLPYLLVSALSFINPRYGLKLMSAYIILVLTGVWTFFVSARAWNSAYSAKTRTPSSSSSAPDNLQGPALLKQ